MCSDLVPVTRYGNKVANLLFVLDTKKRRMRGGLIETFKIINGIFNHGRHFFNISNWKFSVLIDFEKQNLLTNWVFLLTE